MMDNLGKSIEKNAEKVFDRLSIFEPQHRRAQFRKSQRSVRIKQTARTAVVITASAFFGWTALIIVSIIGVLWIATIDHGLRELDKRMYDTLPPAE
jgi:hypothetical protein